MIHDERNDMPGAQLFRTLDGRRLFEERRSAQSITRAYSPLDVLGDRPDVVALEVREDFEFPGQPRYRERWL